MRLVLLPGLNGSSTLFAALLPHLPDLSAEVIALPAQGPQDYASLSETLSRRLGESPFVLLGESFSGPLAYQLALRQPPGLRGVIFAASFLTRPHPLLPLSPHIPLPRRMLSQHLLLKLLCLDSHASRQQLEALSAEISRLPLALLRARLRSLTQLQEPERNLDLPTLHLQPLQDRLVSQHAAASIARHCTNLQQIAIAGPHFLLQSKPEACARAIRSFLAQLASA